MSPHTYVHLMYSRAQSILLLPISCPPMLLVSPLTCRVLSDSAVAAAVVVTRHGTINDLKGCLLKGEPCRIAPVGLWVMCVQSYVMVMMFPVLRWWSVVTVHQVLFLQQTGSCYSHPHPVCVFFSCRENVTSFRPCCVSQSSACSNKQTLYD